MVPKRLTIEVFTRKRVNGNSDGRQTGIEYIQFSGYRSKKRRVFRGPRGEQIESNSVIVPRDNDLDIKLGDRIFEGEFTSDNNEPEYPFEVIGKDTGKVPGTTKTHHEQIYLK